MKKEKRSALKTEVASSSRKPFEERPIEYEEEASKKKNMKSLVPILKTEYEDMDTEEEGHEVRKLTKEELEVYHQYKEFLHNSGEN